MAIWLVSPALEGQSAASDEQAAIEVTLQCVAPFEGTLQGGIRFEPMTGRDRTPIDVSVEPASHSSQPITITAVLPPHQTWRVRTGLSGAWGADSTLKTGGAGSTTAATIQIWPAGLISGRFLPADRATPLPTSMSVELSAPTAKAALRKALGRARACPIRDDGRWQCRVPAGRFDLVLRPDAHVPLYHWAFDVGHGKQRDIGETRLKRGASLTGWVEAASGLPIPADARVYAEPMVAGGRSISNIRLATPAADSLLDERGFFQLAGIEPGFYRIAVDAKGFAESSVFPLEVLADHETALREPIVLQLPMDISLAVQPAQPPSGGTWRVEIMRMSDATGAYHPDHVFRGATDEAGNLAIFDQTPGRFTISISDENNQRWASRFAEPIEGVGVVPVEIEVDWVGVSGLVSLGDTPVVGEVVFGGAFGAERVLLATDEDGRYEGVIPYAGTWRVQVRSQKNDLDAETTVLVDADTEGVAEVDIEMPDTHIWGQVVDPNGKPVPRTSVGIAGVDSRDQQLTDEQGQFSFRAHDGLVRLIADTDDGQQASMPYETTLSDGMAIGPIELRLEALRTVSGVVRSTVAGPLGGAVVHARQWPTANNVPRARTERDGTFTFHVTNDTETLDVMVAAPGHALEVHRVDGQGALLDLDVSPGGGVLVLPAVRNRALDVQTAVVQNDIPLSIAHLLSWALRNGGTLDEAAGRMIVPNMAPGDYRLCEGPLGMANTEAFFEAADCVAGMLQAGGTLELIMGDADAAR
ncbi:MAG: carboxypeptidase-like regulatory domain-containing protein [Acidobacteriota bacterium]